MKMICDKCGEMVLVTEGEYIYYRNLLFFACNKCAKKINDETKCAMQVCSALDSKKKQAENIISNKNAFDKFIKDSEAVYKKLPETGSLRSDLPLFAALVKSYINGDYQEISYNKIITVISTLLYVISPLDIIPDIIPSIGFTDDAMAVSLCKKIMVDDLKKFEMFIKQTNIDMQTFIKTKTE